MDGISDSAELKKIILAQRKHYGDAILRLSEILRESNLDTFAEIALRFRENYGLTEAIPLSNTEDIESQFVKILRIENRWMTGFEIRTKFVGRFERQHWNSAIKNLIASGIIKTRGSYKQIKYKLMS